ncbi:hypothetical protein [Roseospira visakhapatnamensis]|uniref:Uncharacterized protein n=1 Tax=Roseospira visakhapatnamensis TaxID=390880 RepID=A0A7W6RET6_9PROT|nr:hypothetical protein [Roseospira visakhapatnamensis]MBB4266746.1 hypothetical protein [Roseospira visakhapatnamensis]
MADITYVAQMVDAADGPDATYEFQADETMFERPRAELIACFMDYVDHVELPREDIGYEIYSAFKNRDLRVVTAMGTLRLRHGDIPFMVMISPKKTPLSS